MDLCNCKIISYAYGLAIEAIKNTYLNVKEIKGILLPSDFGNQYTRQIFKRYLSAKKIWYSFNRKGNLYDNACMKSFYSMRKKEEIYLHISSLQRSPKGDIQYA